MAEDLRRMAIEDDVFREPKNPSKLTQMERVDYLVFKLRDVAEQSVFSPGQTHVLSYSRTGAGPAVALWKEGKAAIPALLALLEDERPTRSFSGAMNGAYVLRYGDVVLQILEGIAGRRFDRQTIRGAYFLSAPQDLHRSIKADVEGWWSKNKGREETQWLRESLLETGVDHRGKRAQLWAGQRLIDLDSAAAAEFFQKLLQGQRDDDFLARLLLEAQAADHENPSPEQPAAADGEDAAAEP